MALVAEAAGGTAGGGAGGVVHTIGIGSLNCLFGQGVRAARSGAFDCCWCTMPET